MSIFKPLRNQCGALLLTFVAITAIGGTILAVLGPQVASTRDKVQAPLVKAVEAAADTTKDGPTNEEIQESKDTVVLVGKLGLATGAIINSATSISPGGTTMDALGTGLAVVTDVAIGDMVSRGSNPAPTTSNTPPSNVQPLAPCKSTSLTNCTNTSSCVSVGGYWSPNNTCKEPTCDNHHISLCTTNSDCSGASGYWYNELCNAAPGCDSSSLGLCPSESDCSTAGGYWYNSNCNSEPENPCGDGGIFSCNNGVEICSDRACNGTDDCGDGSDESSCGTEVSCCISTNGCPSETGGSCGDFCCCCDFGYVCDRSNPANGCIPSP